VKNLLLVISGPSGSGKSTLCDLLVEGSGGNIALAVSHTSRPIRANEKEGVDYCFLSREEFQSNIEADRYLEWAEVHGNYYGTPKDRVSDFLKSGRDVILEIDVQGGLQVKKVFPETVLVFVTPSKFADLEERLRKRGTDSETIINTRLKNALAEFQKVPEYDYVVFNHNLHEAVRKLGIICEAEKMRTKGLTLSDFFEIIAPPVFS
jgi:guanylate kinase